MTVVAVTQPTTTSPVVTITTPDDAHRTIVGVTDPCDPTPAFRPGLYGTRIATIDVIAALDAWHNEHDDVDPHITATGAVAAVREVGTTLRALNETFTAMATRIKGMFSAGYPGLSPNRINFGITR